MEFVDRPRNAPKSQVEGWNLTARRKENFEMDERTQLLRTTGNADRSRANLSCYRWQKLGRGLYQTPIAAQF